MIIAALLLLQGYSPETEAVMNRSRQQAQERRAATSSARGTKAGGEGATGSLVALPLPPEVAARLQACLDTAIADPTEGAKVASEWALAGGSYHAAQCRGFAFSRAEQWDQAITAFDAGAAEAEKAESSLDAARLWVQAGNAALAGGKPDSARGYFDAALGHGLPDGLPKGEVYLDRARANVALDDLMAARTDMDVALNQAPQDPLAWLLSATLARRMNDLVRAKADIARAGQLSPDDASVALETGNVAMLTGDEAAARAAWTKVQTIAPDSEQGKAARAALAQLGAEAPVPQKP
ncbi:hypothetical protein [Sphingobium subterraneum]|uniref:Tetratricopeptide (TPR) repeat protein n=1 Tax=Sphingobium subterraneum TaxID=627688 RepID=A0A841IZU5_9SPHN|nr:hypothetical protein [Sphingobium subterraneum]MBB6124489.1 tetratricopeptide (TPR) repeat protein [Sphingobium subterraneum]